MTAERPRRDWRDTVAEAADLALLGLVVAVAALPVLTLAPAVAAASAALHDRSVTGSWPPARTSLARFARGLPAGAAVSAVALAVAALLAADLLALATGRVPGRWPALAVTAVVVAALLGYAGLVAVAVGRTEGRGWRSAARHVTGTCLHRPGVWAAAAGTCALATVLTALVTPVAVPILGGYALAALHAVDGRRLSRAAGPAEVPAPLRPEAS
ncbi:hypothetical protein [Micromonospora sp. WMMD980]|uniref:hypothetical protein n=1 Tax=Micromonospora sp. WMMD980 TaxID=3016088 RepID=UPI002417331B|nr:hypothetical protein [Micromonospora sp. WMMD980]MDG4800466.1 hypothetical protein [Micromonospora sp. WMMD980]